MPLKRFRVPHGMPPVVISGAPHGPDDEPFSADPKAVAALVRSGGLVAEPTPKAAGKPQEADA